MSTTKHPAYMSTKKKEIQISDPRINALKYFFLRCLSSGGLEFDIIDFKHRIRRFGSNLTEKINALFASPFIYVTEGRILVALTL